MMVMRLPNTVGDGGSSDDSDGENQKAFGSNKKSIPGSQLGVVHEELEESQQDYPTEQQIEEGNDDD